MKVVTCITDSEHFAYKYALKASCDYFKLNLVTLMHDDTEWETHRNKDDCLIEYLETQNPKEVILFTDGYDTFFVGGEDEIFDRYTNCSKVLVAAEVNCSPAFHLALEYPVSNKKYRYLNSGAIIGTTESLLTILYRIRDRAAWLTEYELDMHQWSNQYLWSLFLLRQSHNMELDTNCELFQSFTSSIRMSALSMESVDSPKKIKRLAKSELNLILQEFICKDRMVYNKTTESYPIHLHFNSPLTKYVMFKPPFSDLIEKFNT